MATKGYFTIAQGEQYVRCAYALALSLKASQSKNEKLSIGVENVDDVPEQYRWAFDHIIELPWGDHSAGEVWKRKNEWKAIHMTPYDYTIKLDADMLFPADVSYWWDGLMESQMVFTTKVRNYRGQVATNDFYRKTFTDNDLPNIYTAFMYFEKTDMTFEYFHLCEMITNNWEKFYEQFLDANSRPKHMSADVVFALAAKILNAEDMNYNPHYDLPTFVHMKTRLQGWDEHIADEEWPSFVPTYFTPECQLKVGNYLQELPFHYHQKQFLTDEIIGYLEQRVM